MNVYKNIVIFYSSFVNLAEILLKAFSSFSMPSCLCFCLWPLGKLAVVVDPLFIKHLLCARHCTRLNKC